MIQIQDVSFEYEKEQGTLSHIDLNIQQGECVVLTGESGCGKTTVTKLINGLIPHFVEGGTLSGTTIVNGMEVPKTEMYRLAEQVGSVFQNPKSQFFNIDSDSEITFGLENAGDFFHVWRGKTKSCVCLCICHEPVRFCAGRADSKFGCRRD